MLFHKIRQSVTKNGLKTLLVETINSLLDVIRRQTGLVNIGRSLILIRKNGKEAMFFFKSVMNS